MEALLKVELEPPNAYSYYVIVRLVRMNDGKLCWSTLCEDGTPNWQFQFADHRFSVLSPDPANYPLLDRCYLNKKKVLPGDIPPIPFEDYPL